MQEGWGVQRYKVVRLVGRGGMGELYEVWDTRLERRVAVKRLHPHLTARPDSEALVLREARAAAKVEHRNVVRIYGVEQAGEELLIEMEFIEGRPLNSLFFSGPLPAPLAADLLRQCLEGLGACHARNVVHCDLKPANILVHGNGTVYLTDFGISRALRDPLELDGRADESVPARGTPRYSPPEAWRGLPPTPAWDFYSLGVVMYEALTGTAPFAAQTMADIRKEVFAGPSKPLQQVRQELSPLFCALIDSLIAIDPAARPATARAALDRLKETPEYRQRTEETKPLSNIHYASEVGPKPRAVSRHRARVVGLCIGVSVLTVSLIALLAPWFRQQVAQEAPNDTAPSRPPDASALLPVASPDNRVSPPQKPLSLKPPKSGHLGGVIEPKEVHLAHGVLYYAWDDGIHGEEPWAIPELGKPHLLGDVNPGPEGSHPHDYVDIDNRLYFAATTESEGEEIWFTWGFEHGKFSKPELLLDILPGPGGAAPDLQSAHGHTLLFYATTFSEGRELWRTNGAAKQTSIVADLYPGQEDSCTHPNPRYWTFDDAACFISSQPDGFYLQRYVWATNQLDTPLRVGFCTMTVCSLNGILMFTHNGSDDRGEELWRFAPKSRDLQLVYDIWPGMESSTPRALFAWPEKSLLLFGADDGEVGYELWRSDGTPEGTYRLMDINPGTEPSDPGVFIDMGDSVVFRATDPDHGRELWVTDGTAAGTHILLDIAPGVASSNPYGETRVGDRLFFSGADGGTYGEELWGAEKIQGKWASRLAGDLLPGVMSSYPRVHAVDDKSAIVVANRRALDRWFYRMEIASDGTIVFTELPRAENNE